jgi:hypothetical protein
MYMYSCIHVYMLAYCCREYTLTMVARWPAGLLLLLAAAPATTTSRPPPATIIWDGAGLVAQRTRALAGDMSLAKAIAVLAAAADEKLGVGPFTVLNKTIVPPTGDMHDYLSTESYGWPCTQKCDATVLAYDHAADCSEWCYGSYNCNWTHIKLMAPGEPPMDHCNVSTGVPWVSHSGFSSPQVLQNNRKQADGMWRSVTPLVMAWWYTNDTKYLAKATHLLRYFFLSPNTRMNPSLDYTEHQPGTFDGVSGGINDFYGFPEVIDCLILIGWGDESGAYWRAADAQGMHAWAVQFQEWFVTSPNPRNGLLLSNDICVTVDKIGLSTSLFVGAGEDARFLASNSSKRMLSNLLGANGDFTGDGAATGVDSFGYHMADMMDFFVLAQMVTRTGEIDLFNWVNPKGAR